MSSPRQLAVRDKVENVEAEEMVKMLDDTLARVNPRKLKKLGDLETWRPRIREKLGDVQAEALVDTLAETLGDTEKQSNVVTLGDMGAAELADTLA